jgi:hypothetical protein
MSRLNRLMADVGFGTLLMLCSSGCALAQAPAAQPPQNVEASIADLHRRLQITPAQETQFNTVANVMRENARAEANAPQQSAANATAVDDLRAYIKYSELELAGLKKMPGFGHAILGSLTRTEEGGRCGFPPRSWRVSPRTTWHRRDRTGNMPIDRPEGRERHV